VRVAPDERQGPSDRAADPGNPPRACCFWGAFRVSPCISELVRPQNAINLQTVPVCGGNRGPKRVADPLDRLDAIFLSCEIKLIPESVRVGFDVTEVLPVDASDTDVLQRGHQLIQQLMCVEAIRDIVSEIHGGGEKKWRLSCTSRGGHMQEFSI